jgi:putative membrane protein
MKRLLAISAALVLALQGGTSFIGAAPAAARAADATPTGARAYVMKAGAGDLYEIRSSQIALQKSRDREVRRFAQMMITHHTRTTQKTKAAARASGFMPRPPVLEPMQARMIAELRQAGRNDIDRLYVDQQRTAHDMALALHQNYAQRGDKAPLRRTARAAVPIVRQHIDMLRRMTVR